MKILIIEDEYNLADAVRASLKNNGYQVTIQTDGESGLEEAFLNYYDLILLDVMLPKKNGLDVLKEIRDAKIDSKIIMLTAKSEIEDKMAGFTGGADDYLTKPFHIEELLARISVQLRNDTKSRLVFGDIELDTKNMTLKNTANNKSLNVIGKEYEILELLLSNQNQIFEKERLFEKIWGYDSDSDINSLEAYMSFIRKKLKLIRSEVILKTIRGVGYKLEIMNE